MATLSASRARGGSTGAAVPDPPQPGSGASPRRSRTARRVPSIPRMTGRIVGLRSEGIGTDHLIPRDGAQGPPGGQIDGVLEEPDRAVAHQQVDPAGVAAA